VQQVREPRPPHALTEPGRLDLASMVSRRIKLDEVNDGIALTARAEGARTVIVSTRWCAAQPVELA